MKSSCIIKVGDLLKKAGSQDCVEFQEIMINDLEGLQLPGIAGRIHLQSLNETTIYATLEDVTCSIEEMCEKSEELYIREVLVEEYTARFALPSRHDLEDTESDDEIFEIDSRDMSIDIEEMLFQAIKLQEPLVKIHPNYQVENTDDDDEDEYGEYGEQQGSVVFI